MCTIFVFVICAKASPARCCGVPLPGLLYDSLPGLSFAYWKNSGSVLNGCSGFDTSTIGTDAISPIGAKSRSTLNGVLMPIAGLIVFWFDAISSV